MSPVLKENRQPTYRVRTLQDETEYDAKEGYNLDFGNDGTISIYHSDEWGRKGRLVKILSPGFWQEVILQYDE